MSNTDNIDKIVPIKKLLVVLGILAGIGYLFFLQPLYTIDFWYDEVMSLEEFILVPLQKTVTDYPAPNNHIFFNLLMNVWLNVFGIDTFAQAADNVFIVRALPLLFCLLTMLYVYKTGKRFFNAATGLLSLIILLTSIPYYNFALQVRGYGLSIMFCSMLLYYGLWFYNNPSKGRGLAIAILTALLLYTIPSNLYAVLSAMAVLGIVFIDQCRKYDIRIAIKFNAAKLIGWFIVGIGLGVLLYLPVGKQVVNNEYVQSEGLFRWEIFKEADIFYRRLYEWEVWIFVLLALGLWGLRKDKKAKVWLLVFAAILLLPFFISFVQGGKPFDRTFLWVLPVFALAIGLVIAKGFTIELRPIASKLLKILVSLLILFQITLVVVVRLYLEKLHAYELLGQEVKVQNIRFNYYLNYYHPHKQLGEFKESYYSDSTPVYLHEVDKYAMHGYLPVHEIKWEPYTDKIPSLNKYYIITAFKGKAIEEFKQYDSAFAFRKVSDGIDFVNILEASRKQ